MNILRKLPLVLFIIGLLFIWLYGIVLWVVAILLQIFIILKFWKRNPTYKQPKKFTIAVLLLATALALFGVGLIQLNSYFGGIGIFMWLAAGLVPFLSSGVILLTIPTAVKN
jgi:hypothetical protein